MEMQGRRVLAVTPDRAWQALNDPEVLAACIPGCEKLEPIDEDRMKAVLALRVGPLAATFHGQVRLSERVHPARYTLHFEGQGGAVGFGSGTAQVVLDPHEQGCEIVYTVQAKVGGKIAQMGQRLIDGVAKSLAETFFQRLDQALQPPSSSATPAPALEAPAPARTSRRLWPW